VLINNDDEHRLNCLELTRYGGQFRAWQIDRLSMLHFKTHRRALAETLSWSQAKHLSIEFKDKLENGSGFKMDLADIVF
jgi:hypothetical protein